MAWKDDKAGFAKIEEGKKYVFRILLPFKCAKCKSTNFYPNYPNVTCSNCGAEVNHLEEAECISGWYHRVQSTPSGADKKRPYRTYLCSVQGSGKQTACIAGLCGRKDPMWSLLIERDQYKKNKDGSKQEVHFGITPQHTIPVYSYNDKSLQFLKFGNDLRAEFARIIEAKRVLAGRDIVIWKDKDSKNMIKYHAEAGDPSAFTVEVDYSLVSLDKIMAFELTDQARIWEFVSTGQNLADNALGAGASTPAQQQLNSAPASSDDVTRYHALREMLVDVGTRYNGQKVGVLIDGGQFDYLAWLAKQAKDQMLRDEAQWLSEVRGAGKLQALIAAATTPAATPEPEPEPQGAEPEPSMSEPEPEPTQEVVIDKTPPANADTQDLVTKANDMLVGMDDTQIIAILGQVYGPYKTASELSIGAWPKDKVEALIEFLKSGGR